MQEFDCEYRINWYNVPNELEQLSGIRLRHIGRNLAKPNYQNQPRKQKYHSFHFITDGHVQFKFEDNTVVLSKGDLFCKFPHVTHQYGIVRTEVPLKMIWIALEGSLLPHLLSSTGLSTEKPYLKQVINREVDMILQKLIQLAVGCPNHKKQLLLYGLIYTLFGELIPDQTDRSSTELGIADWVQKGLDFINLHYCERINIEDVSRHVGVHRTYFSKMFTRMNGITPSAYLQKKRLNKANDLLRNTSLSITEIASAVGYPDVYSFTKTFSKYFGVPPSHIRKQTSAAP